MSSEGIRLCIKLSGAEMNDHVELGEELRPVGLLPGQELGSHKVFQVFVVGDHIDQRSRALKVVTSQLECLMDSKELLVVGIIIGSHHQNDGEREYQQWHNQRCWFLLSLKHPETNE